MPHSITFNTGLPNAITPAVIGITFNPYYVVTAGKVCIRLFIDLINNDTSPATIYLYLTPPANQDQSTTNKRLEKGLAAKETLQVTFNVLPANTQLWALASVNGVISMRVAGVECIP